MVEAVPIATLAARVEATLAPQNARDFEAIASALSLALEGLLYTIERVGYCVKGGRYGDQPGPRRPAD